MMGRESSPATFNYVWDSIMMQVKSPGGVAGQGHLGNLSIMVSARDLQLRMRQCLQQLQERCETQQRARSHLS
jgi:hypothetical protein